MKASIHPKYEVITVTCSCGNTFETRSTLGHDLTIEVCSQCHPFYTGKQKLIDTGGRVQRFRDRYTKSKEVKQVSAEDTATKEPAKKEAASKSAAAKKGTKTPAVAKSKETKSVKKVSKTKE